MLRTLLLSWITNFPTDVKDKYHEHLLWNCLQMSVNEKWKLTATTLQHYCDVPWPSWRLKSRAPRLFVQQFTLHKYWRSTLLVLYDGHPSVTGGFPSQRATRTKKFPCDDVIMGNHNKTRTMRIFFGMYHLYSGLLPDKQNCGLRMHRECREHFPRHYVLTIPTCIAARAWRTCRDACRDR